MISRGAGVLAVLLAFVGLRGDGRWWVTVGLAGAYTLVEFSDRLHALLPPRWARGLSPNTFRWVGAGVVGLTILRLIYGITQGTLVMADDLFRDAGL
ncbi:MAG: hypothetical protein IPP35_00295 [Elusimicrobia bacterium]|nr:hypothetical protein [Elusimicrobiota bacterium]